MNPKPEKNIGYLIELLEHYYELSCGYYPEPMPVWGYFNDTLDVILDEWL